MMKVITKKPIIVRALSALVGFTGLQAILSTSTNRILTFASQSLFLGVETDKLSHSLSIIFGFVLVYLSFQLLAQKRSAWILSVFGLLGLLTSELLFFQNAWQVFGIQLVLFIVIIYRSNFNVKSDLYSFRKGLTSSAILLLLIFAYATVGFFFLDKRDFSNDFDLIESARNTFTILLRTHGSGLSPNNRQAVWFLRSVDIAGLSAMTLIFVSLFKPVRFAINDNGDDLKLAEKILTEHSTSVEDYFKLWPNDKHYYFHKSSDAFLAYGLHANTALILDGPSGNPKYFFRMLKDFQALAFNNGWQTSIIHGSNEIEKYTKRLGLSKLFIGNEAMVKLKTFKEETIKSKHFRYVINKAKKEKLTVSFWDAPHSEDQLKQLENISKQWLYHGGRQEYTFVMGYFDQSYLNKSQIAVLYQNELPVAYVNTVPSFVKDGSSIDQMRFIPDLNQVGMHFLLMKTLLNAELLGKRYFNLGLVPLSGVENTKNPQSLDNLLKVVKKYGRRVYSFGGLEQFKNKFKPDWQPRYIYYQKPSIQALINISRGLNKATEFKANSARLNIMPFAILAALLYSGFIVAPLVGVDLSKVELLSQLGGSGRPFAPLFNSFDILAGILLIGLSIKLMGITAQNSRVLKLSLRFMALFGLSIAMAAMFPDNHEGLIGLALQLVHFIFSSIGLVALLVSAFIFVKSDPEPKLQKMLFSALVISSVVSSVMLKSSWSLYSQIAETVISSLWLIFYLAKINSNYS
jgi:phosphatidylglycerol lysyltransferase